MDEPSLSVVHVTEPVDGGVGRVVLALARDQAARGWRVTIVAPAYQPFRSAVEECGAAYVDWQLPVSLAADRDYRLPWRAIAREFRPLRKAIAGGAPDVVHVHSSVAGFAARAVVRGRVPTVFQPHAWSFLSLSGARRRAAVAWERLAARWTTAVVCVSEGERCLGEAVGVAVPLRVVPNGVDLRVHRFADDDDRTVARARLGLGPGPLVVCVGGIRRQKGQDVLLNAWPRVRARVADAQVALVGDGPERRTLEARRVPGSLFAGERADVREWLVAADVVAVPSRWEGMSLVLLEAMATGRAAVVSDIPGLREVVGDGGAVVPSGAEQPLADALLERLLDPERCRREGRAARRRAEERHDLARSLDAVAGLYRELTVRAA